MEKKVTSPACSYESRFVKFVTLAKGSKNSPMYGKESDLSCLFLQEYETILEEIPTHLMM